MKKTIFGLMALCAVSLGFVSCGGDDIDLNRGTHSEQPQNAKQGTFVGELRVYEGSADKQDVSKTDENATITIAPGEGDYTAKLTVNSPKNAEASGECAVNISWRGDDVVFFVHNATGTLGAGSESNVPVNGYTAGDYIRVVYTKFVKPKGSRVGKTYVYAFEGTRKAAE